MNHQTNATQAHHARSEQASAGKRRIVVLSQFYTPEPHRFASTIAGDLAERGYDVSVVTGYPNRPGGKLYPEYRQRLKFSEVINGIRVHRVPLIINHSRRAVERIANFLTFGVSALTVTAAIRQADVVYVYGTPATAAIPAQIWQKFLGIPYVVHVQDLWPESVTDSGMVGNGATNRTIRTVLTPWLKRLYGKAAGLVAISPGMKELLVARGAEPDRCSVVYNWAVEPSIRVKAAETFSDNGLRLLYAGNLGVMQDLETVIAAARHFETSGDVQLEIAGGGTEEETLHQAAAGASNIEFLGRLSKEDVADRYLQADFQLVTLKDAAIFRTTIPSKLQASLASGVPVITTVQGDVARLITEHQAGIVAQPEDPESLAEAFQRARAMSATERAEMGANARRLYVEKMSQASALAEIEAILNTAAKHNTPKTLVEETP